MIELYSHINYKAVTSLGLNTYSYKREVIWHLNSESQFKKSCVNFIRLVVEKNKDVILMKDSWEIHLYY